MRCPDDAMLYDFLSGQLRAEELSSIDSHIDECPECREVVVVFAHGSGSGEPRPEGSDAPDVARAFDASATTSPMSDQRARAAATLVLDEVDALDDTRMAATEAPTGREPTTRPASFGRLAGLLPRGSSVARYLILDTLGHGAMGVVYAAYDPELDRRVALKLVRADAVSGARERMEREARAMARLTHVNVVTIYDVGTYDEAVYLSMELIEGETLRAWMARGPHSWRDVRAIFVQVASGLAAAHEAGLVHRDVKPDNVIIGNDGRARVTDFGLARTDANPAQVDSDDGLAASATDSLTLTRTGTLLGTPAYMAPEQFARTPADARTDQFGLCVALYEALHGARPFLGDNLPDLERSVRAGDIEASTRNRAIPRWLHEATVRGLHPDPDERYPDLRALLSELERDPGRRWRRGLALAALVIPAIAAGLFWWTGQKTAPGRVCTGAEAAAQAVWNDRRARAIDDAFAATSAVYAPAGARATIEALNEWRARWETMHEQTCRATRVLGQQSEQLLDVRMHCLSRKLTEFDALAARLERADARTVELADSAVGALGDITECERVDTLTSLPPEPAEPEARARLRALEADIAAGKALIATGSYEAASTLTDERESSARSLGYEPILADLEILRASAQRALGQFEDADRTVQRALELAIRARHDWAASQAWLLRVGIAGARGDFARAHQHAAIADASVARIGAPKEMSAKIANSRGAVLYNLGEYDAAERELSRALALRMEHLGADHPDVARSLTNLGNVARARGDLTLAQKRHERALAIDRGAFGPEHPNVGRHLHNLARILRLQDRKEAALEHYRQALAIKSAALGDDHYQVGLTHNSLGLLFYELDDLASAEPHYRIALDIFEAVGAAETALSAYNLGLLLLESERPDRAELLLARSRDEYLSSLGPGSERVAEVERALADARAAIARSDSARPRSKPVDSVSQPPPSGSYAADQSWDGP